MSKKKPTVLMILDGYGLNDKVEGNAVKQANTPVMDDLMANCPFVEGQASGMAVGLPEGQMGNSEVGHLNMGAGRIVYQELTRITKSIQDGDFFENEAFLAAAKNCKENGSALHLMKSFLLLWKTARRIIQTFIFSVSYQAVVFTATSTTSMVCLSLQSVRA